MQASAGRQALNLVPRLAGYRAGKMIGLLEYKFKRREIWDE